MMLIRTRNEPLRRTFLSHRRRLTRYFSAVVEEDSSSTNSSFVGNSPVEEDVNDHGKPVLLNSKEHAVGYLNRILNARVYEAAIETKLQYANNLSERLQNNGKEIVLLLLVFVIESFQYGKIFKQLTYILYYL